MSISLAASLLLVSFDARAAEWQPGPSPLMTRWGKQLDPNKVWTEYPRPQLQRVGWTNLNGLWDLAIVGKDEKSPREFTEKILVPFAVESSLSGVTRPVEPNESVWYRRTFEQAKPSDYRRVLLHFDAVDWETTVFVNGREVGVHRGGFDPFQFDITDFLKSGANQELVVRVWDPTDQGAQPRGKQQLRPEGIWYTPVTGIWQTVWLEEVDSSRIESLRPTPNIDEQSVSIALELIKPDPKDTLRLTVSLAGETVVTQDTPSADSVVLSIANPKLWSPDSPTLYDLQVELIRNGKTIDNVKSYFAMRKISIGKDPSGNLRLLLNNKTLFHYGPLDQGWWPDGLLTPPSAEAMEYDLKVLKSLGMNMLRKHIKVEPSRLYHACDRLGLLVWQDMPSSMQAGRKHFVQPDHKVDGEYTEAEKTQFRTELKAMIDHLRFFPSIVVWVPFNEGWGQHDTNDVLAWVKQYDPSRLVDGPSGWTDRGFGDMKDMHNYPGPNMFPVMPDRVSVLGEFGGLGLPLEGHLWKANDNWGYRTYKTREELQDNYEQLMQKIYPLIGQGLAAAVYTQTTDVEIEVNGLMTYDREVIKLDPKRFANWHRQLTGPTPRTRQVLPDAQTTSATWRYTTEDPGANWYSIDKSPEGPSWRVGTAGFGSQGTPGGEIRTEWTTSDIWLRRDFELIDIARGRLLLSIHHDEDAEVYINGELAAELKGYTSGYTLLPLDGAASKWIHSGKNSISIHCHQTTGGQYIDAGLVEVGEP